MNDHLPATYAPQLTKFEHDVKELVQRLRETLAFHNIGDMAFDIEVRGRTCAGSATVAYKLSERYGMGTGVTASTIRPCVEEFLRRKGFDTLHAPTELPAPGKAVDEELF